MLTLPTISFFKSAMKKEHFDLPYRILYATLAGDFILYLITLIEIGHIYG